MGDYAFHRMRVEVLARAGVIRHHAHDAALFGARQAEIACCPGHGDDAVDVANAAGVHGLRPTGVGADNLVGQIGIHGVDGGLGAGNVFPGIESAGGEIGDGLEGAVAGVIVDNGEGSAGHIGFGEHLRFGWLIERQNAELRAGGEFRRGTEDAGGGADLIGGERRERMRGGGRGLERD